jgi:hypothetical protein
VAVAEAVTALVEVVKEVATAPREVVEAAATAPVKVVEEAESSNGAHRHSAQGGGVVHGHLQSRRSLGLWKHWNASVHDGAGHRGRAWCKRRHRGRA